MNRLTARRGLAAALLIAATALVAATSGGAIDGGRSRITATFTQMDVPVEGTFNAFRGSVFYDAATPANSSAELVIDTASFDIGDEEYNAEVRKPEWFDTQAHPTATFKSGSVRSLGADRFEAVGQLALKGRTQTVKAVVSVKTEGKVRRFEGTLPLSRRAFALGDPGWDEVLEDKVLVKFVIVVPTS